jgi:hypothetical protein
MCVSTAVFAQQPQQQAVADDFKDQMAQKDLQIAQLTQQLHSATMMIQLYEHYLGIDVQKAQDDKAVKDAQVVMAATQKASVSKRTEKIQK